MHILFIIELFPPHIGGAEVLFDNLISGLRKKGHTITVLTTRFDQKLAKYEHREDGYEIYRVGHNRYDFMIYAFFLGLKLAKKADIIHTTTYNAAIPSSLIGSITKKKVVITVHEIFGHLWKQFVGWKWPFFRFAEKMIFLFPFAKYICVSNYTRNMLHEVEKIPFDKLVTVYNGIDYDIWNPDSIEQSTIDDIRGKFNLDKKYVGFFFGRPGISKGVEYFIRSIPTIVSKIPEFMAFLLVAKDDKSRFEYVKGLATHLGVDSHIIRGDKVPYKQLPGYVAMANFTVVPSLTEGFGFAAVEACTIGKPVIVSRGGSLPEVVSGQVLFVKPANAEDIAEKVYEIYTGHTNTIEKKSFLWDDTVQETIDVYTSIIE